jgi:hypothetical protein
MSRSGLEIACVFLFCSLVLSFVFAISASQEIMRLEEENETLQREVCIFRLVERKVERRSFLLRPVPRKAEEVKADQLFFQQCLKGEEE